MALVAPPRHCVPEIGRQALGEEQDGHVELQSFACGLTGRCAEVPEPQACELQGTVPQWLQGDLYRNGPGTWDIKTKSGKIFSMGHWYNSRKTSLAACISISPMTINFELTAARLKLQHMHSILHATSADMQHGKHYTSHLQAYGLCAAECFAQHVQLFPLLQST